MFLPARLGASRGLTALRGEGFIPLHGSGLLAALITWVTVFRARW